MRDPIHHISNTVLPAHDVETTIYMDDTKFSHDIVKRRRHVWQDVCIQRKLQSFK